MSTFYVLAIKYEGLVNRAYDVFIRTCYERMWGVVEGHVAVQIKERSLCRHVSCLP